MGSNRARRDKKKALKERSRSNALFYSGQINNLRCLLPVLVGPPEALKPDGSMDLTKLVPIQAVIDTGATRSCASPALAKRLGLVSHGKATVGVVGGSTELDQAPLLVCFPSKDGVPIYKIIPVSIGNIAVPMLFGMQELTPGILTVDCMRGTWEWKVLHATLRSPHATATPAAPNPPPPSN